MRVTEFDEMLCTIMDEFADDMDLDNCIEIDKLELQNALLGVHSETLSRRDLVDLAKDCTKFDMAEFVKTLNDDISLMKAFFHRLVDDA